MPPIELIDMKTLFVLVAAVLFLHELEEWNIDEYHRKNYTETTVKETKLSVRLWLFFLSAIGFLWAFIASLIPNALIGTVFFMLLVDFTSLNGIQHVLISLKTKKYNPGLLFGGLAGLSLNTLVIAKILAGQILPLWLLTLLLLLIVPGLVQTIKGLKETRMPKMLVKILEFSLKLEKIMTE